MVAVAKTLNDTSRRTKVLEIKGGILQGTPLAASQVVELASLPPADVLKGQVVGAIVGPLNAIVALFAAPLHDLVGLLDARVEQLGEPEPAAEAEPDVQTTSRPEAPAARPSRRQETEAETTEAAEEPTRQKARRR